jgi:hypothetical protein
MRLLIICLVAITMYGCKKLAGPGGKVSITGKVKAINYDNSLNSPADTGYIGGIKVYLKYGVGSTVPVSENQDTNYDGVFLFEYLRPGTYEVYVYSKKVGGINKIDTFISKSIVLTKNDKIVDVGDLNIITNKN